MSDKAFFAFLTACQDELADKQARFQQRISSAARWSYESSDCSITIGDKRFPITPIGTHSPEHETWLWAWANEDFPPARAASRRLQALHAATGFQVFLDPGVGASSADAQDFAALALHQLGAIGFFRTASDGPTLYLAVNELENDDGKHASGADGVHEADAR